QAVSASAKQTNRYRPMAVCTSPGDTSYQQDGVCLATVGRLRRALWIACAVGVGCSPSPTGVAPRKGGIVEVGAVRLVPAENWAGVTLSTTGDREHATLGGVRQAGAPRELVWRIEGARAQTQGQTVILLGENGKSRARIGPITAIGGKAELLAAG